MGGSNIAEGLVLDDVDDAFLEEVIPETFELNVPASVVKDITPSGVLGSDPVPDHVDNS